MSLRVKLFGVFMALIIVPLVVLSLALYALVTDMIEEKYSQQTELTLRALSQSVSFIFQEMNKVTDSTIASDAIQDVLKDGYNKDIKEIDYMELNQVQKNFRELLVNHPSVSYAFMYKLDNERIYRIFTKDYFHALPFEQFKQQELYKQVLQRGGLPFWVGPYEYPELTGHEPVFTQIRVVKDIDTLSDKGILLVQIKNSGLESVFRYFRYKQEKYATQFMIVNEQGLVLYDSGDTLNGMQLDAYTERKPVLDTTYASERHRFQGRDSIISSMKLDNEQWHLVSVTSWASVASEVLLYSKWVAIIMMVCLLSACAFILFFANRIARAIYQTVQFMRRVELGDLASRLPVKGNDETALLARGFNSLVRRIAELLTEVKRQQERKTHAELQALQAQINPHFLFNALESINILAVQNQGKKVSQMVARLGNILRISIQQKEEITIAQELDHLLSYLEIQKFRFEELFEFEIDIPPELMKYAMLKLTLQPLIENSIQHGFEGIGYMGFIRVSAVEEASRIVFLIEDNGIGIAPDRLAALERKRELLLKQDEQPQLGQAPSPDETRGQQGQSGHHGLGQQDRHGHHGLGVHNVADRIRIQYGSQYGLILCSEQGQGTAVRLAIPKKYAGSVPHEAEGAAH